MSEIKKRRVGIIGYGHLGQFLRHELSKSDQFSVERIWNRSEGVDLKTIVSKPTFIFLDEQEKVLPLTELTDQNLKDIDLIIEVAHPIVVENFASLILKHCDFFVSSLKILKFLSNCYYRLALQLLWLIVNFIAQLKNC